MVAARAYQNEIIDSGQVLASRNLMDQNLDQMSGLNVLIELLQTLFGVQGGPIGGLKQDAEANGMSPARALEHGSHDLSSLNDPAVTGHADFDIAVEQVLQAEGYLSDHVADRGGLTKYGISQNANPDIDVANLTQQEAIDIYQERYWDQIDGIEDMSQAQALVAFDTAVNHGVGYANKLVAETNGDIGAMLNARLDYYDQIIANDASQAVFAAGWDNRIENLAEDVAQIQAANDPVYDQNTPRLADNFSQAHNGLNPDSTPDTGPAPQEEPALSQDGPEHTQSLTA